MNKIRVYHEANIDSIDGEENKYNFLPKHVSNNNYAINKICLRKTLNIAKNRKRLINTENLEKSLKEYRKYAIKETN